MTGSDLATASTVLVIASPVGDTDAKVCTDLLAERADLDRLIVVPVGSTPAGWESRLSARPSLSSLTRSYVDVKTTVRSSSATDSGTAEAPSPVATISSPADLASLGTVLNDGLSHATGADERVAVCLHSVSDMLQFVDREFLFRFFHTLGARVRRVDGVAYYVLAPDAGEEIRSLFAQICDAVVTVEDGAVSVSAGPDVDTADTLD